VHVRGGANDDLEHPLVRLALHPQRLL
jgi:hypothetical protein